MRVVRRNFNNIKIDKSILWDLCEDERGAEILKTVMDFIKNQGSSVV